MQKIKVLLFIYLIPSLLSSNVSIAQKPVSKPIINYIVETPDDPIASILDSLQALKLFECSGYSIDTCLLNTYNYSPNFIPYFDDLTIEARLNKLDIKSPFDLVYNESVKHYINLYTNKKRYDISKVLGLSHLYFNLFEVELDKYNLPLELKYLAIVESALNPNAISKTGATGLWQFMLPTGKMFGLNITSYVDERKDPYKATLAACKYLKYLYNLFGDWQMVLAAYNSGPGTVSKAIRRSGGKTTYWEIRSFLPKETQNYVPAFISVNYAMNYSREHNLFPLPVKSNYFFSDTVHVKQEVSFKQISAVIDVNIEDLQFFNPSYKLNCVPFNIDGSVLNLPANKIGSFINNEEKIYQYKQIVHTTKYLEKQLNKLDKFTYKTKSKESLYEIASRYGLKIEDIKKWNNLKKNIVNKGRILVLYKNPKENISVKYTEDEVLNNNIIKHAIPQEEITVTESRNDSTDIYNKESRVTKFLLHKVQHGDTLWNIANRYSGITVEDLKRANNFKANKKLKIGEKIKVPLI